MNKMACVYEEEIFKKKGEIEKCGCPECPCKTLDRCKEVKLKIGKEGEK